jgi:hypothetical protein
MGPFWGGMPPVVAPEGDLVFWESRVALFIELLLFTRSQPIWGVGQVSYNKKLGNPS